MSSDTLIPELLTRHPDTRGVFDRYGLRGCGGRLGPVETLGFFARAHGVPDAVLIREITRAIDEGAAGAGEGGAARLEDTIYRRFFTAGILLTLTAGAAWGAWLLWRIGFARSFASVSIHEVNAHGHAQIFGWVGLFVMGFGYQAFPRIWHVPLPAPRLAVAAFGAMLTGIVARTAGMASAGSTAALLLAMAGGALECAAVAAFAAQVVVAFRRARLRLEPYVAFILGGLAAFAISSVFSLWHAWNTMTAASPRAVVEFVSTYQPPLRDLQIHGFALFLILGVSLRMLPALFGVPQIGARRAWGAFAIVSIGVVGEATLYLASRSSGNAVAAAFLVLPWAALAFGVGLIALPWKLWRPLPITDRSGKFVRAAYGWLGLSLAMLLLVPIHQAVSGTDFSRAYHGATRHAITVGFVSMMIVGFAAKVVPTLNGVDPRRLTALWGPFILLNAGCALRVATQSLTDWRPAFFGVVGVSGMLEVTALAWWGAGLLGIMARGARTTAESYVPTQPVPGEIEARHHVADVLAWFPSTEEVFAKSGFPLIKNAFLRRTVARRITIEGACRLQGVPVEKLLEDLNACLKTRIVFERGTRWKAAPSGAPARAR